MESRQIGIVSRVVGCTVEIWLGGDRFVFLPKGCVYGSQKTHTTGYFTTVRAFNGQVSRHFEAIEGSNR